MRFIALTTIAALAFASVSTLPVDPSNGVGVHPKDIPLSKRTDELNGTPALVDAAGSGQGNGGRGISQAKMDGTSQGQNPPSKRTEQIDDAASPPVSGNGISQAKMGDASQGQNPPSKRQVKLNGGDNSGKKDDGAATGETTPLSKRTGQVNGELPLGSGQATDGSGAATDVPNQTSNRDRDAAPENPPVDDGEF